MMSCDLAFRLHTTPPGKKNCVDLDSGALGRGSFINSQSSRFFLILCAAEEAKSEAAKMASQYDAYQTSLTSRYCSLEMSKLFSQRSRHSTWRKLWLGLAECEKELGIDTITPEALEQMKAHLEVTDEDFETARIEEKRRRHVRIFSSLF